MTERLSIKEPILEILATYDKLSEAADAHLAGLYDRAEELFWETQEVNLPVGERTLWNWLNPAWGPKQKDLELNVRNWRPKGDTHRVPKELRDGPSSRGKIPESVKAAVFKRDGHRCRYCGIPVISAEIRKLLREVEDGIYAKAIPWINNDEPNEHAAFQCMWLQYDHVMPWSHGGRSNEANVVISCALCNFGKADFTLAQLEVADPRLRPPVPCVWDGLERLRTSKGTTAMRFLKV